MERSATRGSGSASADNTLSRKCLPRTRYVTSNASLENSFQYCGSRSSAGCGPAVGDRIFSSCGMAHGPDRPPSVTKPGNKTSCDCLSSLRNTHSSSLSATARARHITAQRNRSRRYGRRHSQQSPSAIGSPCNPPTSISLIVPLVKRFVTNYGMPTYSFALEAPDTTRCRANTVMDDNR